MTFCGNFMTSGGAFEPSSEKKGALQLRAA